jgi:hypothetical protein
MKPTIGRIVIYCCDGYELAAIITRVVNPETATVDLTVFPHPWCGAYLGSEPRIQDAPVAVASVQEGEGKGMSRFWKWPPRV